MPRPGSLALPLKLTGCGRSLERGVLSRAENFSHPNSPSTTIFFPAAKGNILRRVLTGVSRSTVDQGELAMKSRILFVITIACTLGAWLPSANASGYLTPFGTGVAVTDYMVNNNVGYGGSAIGITILLSPNAVNNPDSCGSTALLHIKSSAHGYKEMVAAVMAAVASGRRIGFHSSGCELLPFFGGTTTYPIVTDLWVVN
jgi:hypothetical protein